MCLDSPEDEKSPNCGWLDEEGKRGERKRASFCHDV